MDEQAPGSEARPLRVAVVGSGPSGFYAVGSLFKQRDFHVEVDLFDRLPTPYGLVRGGVAPDHQNIKAVIRVYHKTAQDPGFRFFGNVKIGTDLEVEELGEHYDQIVFATGNETDRKMGIPGEELPGVHSGTELVGWYNGHPDFRHHKFDLEGATRVAVVGNGNVAMDVTRVLATDPDELATTDIAGYALDALRRSRVQEILLLGRRGPAQAAFSPREIKEIGRLAGADLVVAPEEVEIDALSQRWVEERAAVAARDNLTFLRQASEQGTGSRVRKVHCRFLVSPVEVLAEGGRTAAVRLERNELYEDAQGTPRPRGTGQISVEKVQLVFKAVGYRGIPVPGVPFDEKLGIFPNKAGRLLDPATGRPIPGQYVVGWAKRGPTGLIGTNRPDAEGTVRCMIKDAQGAPAAPKPPRHRETIVEHLRSKGIEYVTFEDWLYLDQEEVARGKAKGKIREKLTSVEEMMAILRRRGEP